MRTLEKDVYNYEKKISYGHVVWIPLKTIGSSFLVGRRLRLVAIAKLFLSIFDKNKNLHFSSNISKRKTKLKKFMFRIYSMKFTKKQKWTLPKRIKINAIKNYFFDMYSSSHFDTVYYCLKIYFPNKNAFKIFIPTQTILF